MTPKDNAKTAVSTWLVDKIDPDVVFRAALYKERTEASVDGVRCELDVVCPDNIIVYLAVRALADAPPEVKAAGYTLLNLAHRSMRYKDTAVHRFIKEVFDGVESLFYDARHADEARRLMVRELRRCVVCRIDVYTLFELFIKCVKVSGRNYIFVIRRRDGGAVHVASDSLANALDAINNLLMAEYRVAVDTDAETFEALTKIYAITTC
jgi:hypothetical protein